MKNVIWIAIDGPAGSGKSTIANTLLRNLDNFIHINTGLMYRALAYFFDKHNIDINSEEQRIKALKKFEVLIDNDHVFIIDDGIKEDITIAVQDTQIAKLTSLISTFPEVRSKLVFLQREIAKNKNVIMDGRDIGTVVLSDADLKIYLDASIKKRAERRYKQLKNLNLEIEPDVNVIEAEIYQRDYNDINRALGPLKKAQDAIVVNTDNMTVNECVDKILDLLKNKLDLN